MANHCSEFINSSKAQAGILKDNPIHTDMMYAARTAKLQFVLNVVLNDRKEIIASFAGDFEAAHAEGTGFLASLARVKKIDCDIAVCTNGGYPMDQNIYQTSKGMTTAAATNKEGGVIVLVAGLRDGHGGQGFYNDLAGSKNPREFMNRVSKIGREDTAPDQWTTQIVARVLCHHRLIMVSDLIAPETIRSLHMEYARTLHEAMIRAFEIEGPDAKVVVIPDGLSVIVE
jgi:nickel-dependent lactate racemase